MKDLCHSMNMKNEPSSLSFSILSKSQNSDVNKIQQGLKFLHKDVQLRTGAEFSAQGSVFFVNLPGNPNELILK